MHAIFFSSTWMRWPREPPTCGQRGSWEKWQLAHAPTSTSACWPRGFLPATKAPSIATPCFGEEWWQRWQATVLCVPPSQRANSGDERWQVAHRRGSSSTNRLKRRNPKTVATPSTPPRASRRIFALPLGLPMWASDSSLPPALPRIHRREMEGAARSPARPLARRAPRSGLLVDLRLQAIVLERVLVLQHLHRDPPVQPRPVHREDRGLEVHVVEVHHEQEDDREGRLLAVDDERGRDDPGGRVGREERREPEDEAGPDHHHDAPEHRPVVELLEVHEPVELRPLLLHPEHEEDVVLHVEGVLRHRQHRDRQPLLRREERQVEEVVDGGDDDEDGAHSVPDRGALGPPEHLQERPRVGRRVDVAGAAERPPGDAEQDHAREHEPVLRD